MNIKGTVKQVMDTVVISEKFSKRDLILTTDGNTDYPQHIAIQFTQDRVSLLDGLTPGEEVDVSINIRGREWTSPKGEIKFFNTIEGWKLKNSSNVTSPVESVGVDKNGNSNDDLPF